MRGQVGPLEGVPPTHGGGQALVLLVRLHPVGHGLRRRSTLHHYHFIFSTREYQIWTPWNYRANIAYHDISLHDIHPLAEHIIVHYRFIFVMFLLPVSFLYDIWFYTRNKIVFAMSSAPTKHKEKVLGIQRQVNSCNIFTRRNKKKKQNI